MPRRRDYDVDAARRRQEKEEQKALEEQFSILHKHMNEIDEEIGDLSIKLERTAEKLDDLVASLKHAMNNLYG